MFDHLTKISRIIGPNRASQVRKSNVPGPEIDSSRPDIKFSRSGFRKKVLREPCSKRRKLKVSESAQINSNRSRELENDLVSRFRGSFSAKMGPKTCLNGLHDPPILACWRGWGFPLGLISSELCDVPPGTTRPIHVGDALACEDYVGTFSL